MNAAQKERYRRRLEQLVAHLEPQTQAMGQQALQPSGGQGLNELSNAPTHLGDTGTEENLHEVNAMLMENEEYLLHEARAALSRLQEGTYGRCELCGAAIAQERLEALPYVRLCVDCAAAAQETRRDESSHAEVLPTRARAKKRSAASDSPKPER
jgi:RNA polymerase-binding transcription factor DksA